MGVFGGEVQVHRSFGNCCSHVRSRGLGRQGRFLLLVFLVSPVSYEQHGIPECCTRLTEGAFSILWKFKGAFSILWKSDGEFSILWKIGGSVFHFMENDRVRFPLYGNLGAG